MRVSLACFPAALHMLDQLVMDMPFPTRLMSLAGLLSVCPSWLSVLNLLSHVLCHEFECGKRSVFLNSVMRVHVHGAHLSSK
jgi:hypothetical protein